MKMKKKRIGRRERGSITVLLSLLLIPTIVLTGLLTDLARIKLYSNQALMTADNYGEAVLTQYDNVLKELYGLFAVRQDDEAAQAIETLQNYMKTSFDPSTSSVEFKHLQNTVFNKGKSYDGFMPYKSADLKFEWEAASKDANLANDDVFSTQIGDFMRYRVVEEGADWLFDALESSKSCKADADVLNKKTELDDQVNNALEAEREYYVQLKKMDNYLEKYLKGLNRSYQTIIKRGSTDFEYFKNNTRYEEYLSAAEAAANASDQPADEVMDEDESEDTDTEEESLDLEEEGSFFSNEADRLIDSYNDIYNNGDPDSDGKYEVTFSNYDSEAQNLYKAAEKFQEEVAKIESASREVKISLQNEDVSDDLATNVEKELDQRYSKVINSSKAGEFIAIANVFLSNKTRNQQFGEQATDISYCLDDFKSYYLRYYTNTQDEWTQALNRKTDIQISQFSDFKSNLQYKRTYDELEELFGTNASGSSEEEKAENRKDSVKSQTEEIENKMNEDEEESTGARDIPSGIEDIGEDGKAPILKFNGIVKSAVDSFDKSASEVGNELLLKTYLTVYDFGMFSSRVTEKKEEPQTSLTDYPITDDINYLYGAELEYLYGGYKSSKENLKSTRNQIVTFRAAMNLAASFTVKEVNEAITTATEACMAINPILGVAVAAALRLGFATIETYEDWSLLKDGKSVALMKFKLEELSALDLVKSLLPEIGDASSEKTDKSETASKAEMGGKKKTIELNYEQYMMILLIIFTPRDLLSERTRDLICLNVNNATQGSDFSSLSFTMDKAVTAVKASCSVHLDYAVMPDGFAKKFLEKDTYKSVNDFEKHYYKYSVIRGY